jgi:serine/threonine protein kinase
MKGRTYGKWTIEELIDDSGGNGVVWRVTDREGQLAALKILRAFDSPLKIEKRRKRFLNEIRKLELINKMGIKGVMPILDYDADAEQPWFVMPLAIKLEASGDRTQWAMDTMVKVSQHVADLHQEGIVHRDLKPNNILLLDGEVILSDFGLARFAEDSVLTKTGEGVGSFGFTGPECVGHSDEPPFKCDVYALAKTAWALFSGQQIPPNGELRMPEDSLIREGSSSSISLTSLDQLLVAATTRDPADRPTARQFLEGLQACCHSQERSEERRGGSPATRARALFANHSGRNRRDRQCNELFDTITHETSRRFFAAWRDVIENLGWSTSDIAGGVGSDEATELTKQGWTFRRYFFKGEINSKVFEIGVSIYKQPFQGEARLVVGASIGIYIHHQEHVITSMELETYITGPQTEQVKRTLSEFVEDEQTQYRFLEKLRALSELEVRENAQ